MHLYSFTAPGLALGAVPTPYPLTRPYNHFNVAVLSVMTKALPANKAARQAGVRTSKSGYGYLTACQQGYPVQLEKMKQMNKTSLLEDGPSIVLVALLHPEPVRECEDAAHAHGR
jgi:hypothetical protein